LRTQKNAKGRRSDLFDTLKKRELEANTTLKARIVVAARASRKTCAFLSRCFGRGTCTRIAGLVFWDWRYNAVEHLF
jgi:hypothetical protein